jgi:hypothetical protein
MHPSPPLHQICSDAGIAKLPSERAVSMGQLHPQLSTHVLPAASRCAGCGKWGTLPKNLGRSPTGVLTGTLNALEHQRL